MYFIHIEDMYIYTERYHCAENAPMAIFVLISNSIDPIPPYPIPQKLISNHKRTVC